MKITWHWLIPLIFMQNQPVLAEVITDGSLGGGAQSLPGPNYFIGSALGETRGSNLFHSFSQFNINQGESASFQSPNAINNIFARVTGGNMSLIDGEITGVGQANLWLMNPAGWVIGQHAAINLPGSFHLSTATGIDFKDGGLFLAEPKSHSSLSIASPIDYQFQSDKQATITIDQASLTMKSGTDLSLVGGNIQLKEAHVIVPDGRILLGSNAGNQGKWQLDERGLTQVSGQQGTISIEHAQSTTVPSLSLNSTPVIAEESETDTNPDKGGGKIQLVANQINLKNALMSALSQPDAIQRGGDIVLQADTIKMAHSNITTDVYGDQAGGDIKIIGKDLIMTRVADKAEGGSHLSTSTQKSTAGKGGAIDIKLSGDLRLNAQSSISSQVNGAGAGGDIAVNASSVNLDETSSLSVLANDGNGDAGTLSVTSHGLSLKQDSALESATKSQGDAGNIVISAPHITLDNSTILASSAAQSTGTAGNITINAHSAAESGIARDAFLLLQHSKITTSNSKLAEGNGGNIAVTTGTLAMNGGYIQANTLGKNGIGGTVTVNAERSLVSHEQLLVGGNERKDSALQPTLNVIQAAAPNGESGQVNVSSVELNIAGQLAKVDANFAHNRPIANDPCSVRRGEATSSLTQSGLGGLPPNASDAVSLPLQRHAKGFSAGSTNNADTTVPNAQTLSNPTCDKDKY